MVLLRLGGVFPEAWECYEAASTAARVPDGQKKKKKVDIQAAAAPARPCRPLQGKSVPRCSFEQGYPAT